MLVRPASSVRHALLGAAILALSLLCGCGLTLQEMAPASGPVSEAADIRGIVHGGQFPVSGATVSLYEAGYGGYGGNNGGVTSITVTGSGAYLNGTSPTVTITGGGGTGATATANVTSTPGLDMVSSVTVTNAGTGYTSLPTVTFSGGTTLFANNATGTAAIAGGARLLAVTTTDAGGSFAFTKNSGTATPSGTSKTYACDTANPTAQIYITSVGGNTGSGTNSAAAFLAAIGPCNAISSATQVYLNELSTAATVYALAQYMNSGTAAGMETIGSSGTTQGVLGLNNAVANIRNLTNLGSSATGSIVPPQYTGTNASVAGITVTAAADYPKLIDIANILAACVNSTSSTSNACADLFNNATPPTAGNTSQPSATFGTAKDTIQAAYYLATNPGLPPAPNGLLPTCNNSAASTKANCLFGLISPTAPFQTGTTSAPTDYSVAVNYTATGTCAGGAFIAGAYHANVDASGNLWFINGTATNATIAEMSPIGVPLFCGSGSFTGGASGGGRGLTIDVAGNVWASFNASGLDGIVEIPSGSTTLKTVVNTPANAPYAMTSDGFGNVFYTVSASGGSISELVGAGVFTSTPTPVTAASGLNGTATTTLGYLQADSHGRLWDTTSTVSYLYGLYPTATGTIISIASTSDGVYATFTLTGTLPAGFVFGGLVQISGLTSAYGSQFNDGTFTIMGVGQNGNGTFYFEVPSPNQGTGSVTDSGTAFVPGTYNNTATSLPTTGGTYGLAIDSGNNMYHGGTCCTGTNFKTLFRETPGTAAGSTTVTTAVGTAYMGGANGIRSTVVDGASNVFVGSEFPNGPFGATAAGQTAGSFSVTEINYNTAGSFVALSPTGTTPGTCSTSAGCATGGGFFDTTAPEGLPFDMQIDPSGNLWVLDTGNYSNSVGGSAITEVIGVAVPVVTPLSVAVKNGQLGTKP